jgi:hypothetical protein
VINAIELALSMPDRLLGRDNGPLTIPDPGPLAC